MVILVTCATFVNCPGTHEHYFIVTCPKSKQDDVIAWMDKLILAAVSAGKMDVGALLSFESPDLETFKSQYPGFFNDHTGYYAYDQGEPS